MGGKEVISLYLSSLCSTAFVHSAFSLLTAFFFHLSPSFVTLPCNSFSGGFPQATRRLQKILFPFICIPFIWFFVLNISYILFTSASWFFFVCFYSAPRFLVWFFFFLPSSVWFFAVLREQVSKHQTVAFFKILAILTEDFAVPWLSRNYIQTLSIHYLYILIAYSISILVCRKT